MLFSLAIQSDMAFNCAKRILKNKTVDMKNKNPMFAGIEFYANSAAIRDLLPLIHKQWEKCWNTLRTLTLEIKRSVTFALKREAFCGDISGIFATRLYKNVEWRQHWKQILGLTPGIQRSEWSVITSLDRNS